MYFFKEIALCHIFELEIVLPSKTKNPPISGTAILPLGTTILPLGIRIILSKK